MSSWWIVLAIVAVVAIYLYRRHNKNMVTIRLPREAAENLHTFVGEAIEENQRKTMALLEERARAGVCLSLTSLETNMQKMKDEYVGPEKDRFCASIDTVSNDLRNQYGDQIPVDEAYKVIQRLEKGEGAVDIIPYDFLRKKMDELKTQHDGPGKELLAANIDKYLFELRGKYGDRIPLDEGYKMIDKLAGKE